MILIKKIDLIDYKYKIFLRFRYFERIQKVRRCRKMAETAEKTYKGLVIQLPEK